MEKVDTLTPRQFLLITSFFIMGSAILFIPSIMAATAKNDAWLATILGTLLGLLLNWFYYKLFQSFNGKSLVEIFDLALGKWIGKFCTINLIIFLIYLNSMIIRGLGDFLATQFLKETPMQVSILLLIFIVIYGYRHGITNIARCIEVFLPTLMLLYLLAIVLVMPKSDFSKLLPFLENGFKPLANGVFSIFNYPFTEMVILLMVIPFVKDEKKAKKPLLLGTLLGGVSLFFPVFFGIAVFGSDLLANQIYATYTLAKKLEIPHVFQRIEVIMAIIWLLSIYFKVQICYFVLIRCIKHLFTLEEEKRILLPVGWVLFGTSIALADSNVYFFHFNAVIWPLYAMTIGFLLPLLIFFVSFIKAKVSK